VKCKYPSGSFVIFNAKNSFFGFENLKESIGNKFYLRRLKMINHSIIVKKMNEDSISLNKYIASTGVCSRRQADKLIEEGKVMLNGEVARKGNRVFEGDKVIVDGKPLSEKAKPVYIALNKPPGIVCTTDKNERDNIVDFVNYPQRIFPIGRLDKFSAGLILLTNDGDIVNKILRVENNHEKEYIVTVDKPITGKFIKGMREGVPILDTVTKKCRVFQTEPKVFKIILTQGLNRQIRRMCEYFDYRVTYLRRVRIMDLKLQKLRMGEWRELTEAEVKGLMRKK